MKHFETISLLALGEFLSRVILRAVECSPILMLFLCPPALNAQPGWLMDVVSDARNVVVHKDASVVILYMRHQVDIAEAERATIRVRKVVKVLKPSGLKRAMLIENLSPSREMDDLDGWLVGGNGKVKDLDDKDIMEMSNSGFEGLYHDTRILMARFSTAKVGDIVAFEYEIDESEFFTSYQRFEFQRLEPVHQVQFEVDIPDGWELSRSEWRTEGITFHRNGRSFVWGARDLLFEPEEPYMPPEEYLARRIVVHAFEPGLPNTRGFAATWDSVIAWCSSVLDRAVVTDSAMQAIIDALPASAGASEGLVRAVAKFARNDIRYVAVEIDKGRWHPRPATEVLHNRYGDCKDKTALMRAMLQAVGIPSVAVLVNATRSVDPDFPSPFQFNHCIVGIPAKAIPEVKPTIDGWLLYDPTEQDVPFGSLPRRLGGTYALLIQAEYPHPILIPRDLPEKNSLRQEARIHLKSDGSMTSLVKITSAGDFAAELRQAIRTKRQEQLLQQWSSLFNRTIKNASVEALQIIDLGDSTVITMELAAGGVSPTPDDGRRVKLNIFSPDERSPFRPGSRHHEIWFGPPSVTETRVEWVLPNGWHVDKGILPIASTCRGSSIWCTASVADSVVVYSCTDRRTGTLMKSSEFSEAQSFMNDLVISNNVSMMLGKQ